MFDRRSFADESSAREERANRWTHAVGLLASLVAGPVLVGLAVRSGDATSVASVAVYVLTLVALYAASTAYHSVRRPELKRLLRRLDHSAIFLLIAGTYTPIALVVLRGGLGWTLLAVAWGLGAVGIAWKILYLERFPILGPVYYLVMGWMAVVALEPLVATLDTAEMAWLVAGGLAYTGGIVFYAWKRLPYNHAVWHLFVLAGSVCHFTTIALTLA